MNRPVLTVAIATRMATSVVLVLYYLISLSAGFYLSFLSALDDTAH